MQQNDYSKYIIGKSMIDHKERISLGLTNDEYVLYHRLNPKKTYKDYWKETGLYPSEVRKIISQLKKKGFDFTKTIEEPKKSIKEKRISFEDSDIYVKKAFSEKFKDWSKAKLEYYWNAADEWSENGGRKVNWYKTIANWERRDTKEGKLKFKEEEIKSETNFFANR